MIHCTFENGNKASLRHVVIDALILQEDKLLLIKRADKLSEGGKWALVGGYVERDENLQQAVEREVFEETGYRINNMQLLTIRHNPDRPHEDIQNISFVFFCEALEKEGESDWEATEQRWFSFNELPQEELAFDHSQNIELYLQYKRGEVSLPVFD
jgi:8-oxo-dGTP diphosphatase